MITKADAADLMLNPGLVEACTAGWLHVYAVDTIHEAPEPFTGVPAGRPAAEGKYPEGSPLHMAKER